VCIGPDGGIRRRVDYRSFGLPAFATTRLPPVRPKDDSMGGWGGW
jgi:hypothetical protein